jgi:hypothetical protein
MKRKPRGHKPVNATRLKADGSNYSIWLLKVQAAFRYYRLEHVLERAPHGRSHSPIDVQLGLDILLDMVDDSLASKVVPAGGKAYAISPRKVLNKFHDAYGMSNTAMHSMIWSSLMELKQAPKEGIRVYIQRADELYNQLKTSGGRMSSKTYLQCLKEGVQDNFQLTVRLFEMSKTQSIATLTGALLAEECRAARQQTLKDKVDTNVAMVMTSNGGSHKWAARTAAVGAQQKSTKQKLCWNCGVTGHTVRECPKPRIKPFKFVDDWRKLKANQVSKEQPKPEDITA